MSSNTKLETCEQLEKLVTKSRISGTEKAKDYMACQACAVYVKYLYSELPIVKKKAWITSNKLSDMWFEIEDYEPGADIDRDALDTVERYIGDPMNTYASTGDMVKVYTLLKHLSDLSHGKSK